MSTGAKSGGSWNFHVTSEGWWTWDHRDVQGGELAASHKPFRYFHECIADAKRHGYPGDDGGSRGELRCFF